MNCFKKKVCTEIRWNARKLLRKFLRRSYNSKHIHTSRCKDSFSNQKLHTQQSKPCGWRLHYRERSRRIMVFKPQFSKPKTRRLLPWAWTMRDGMHSESCTVLDTRKSPSCAEMVLLSVAEDRASPPLRGNQCTHVKGACGGGSIHRHNVRACGIRTF